jgi:HTH-type transcriptional repressor of NAD biosynthesis genes
MKNFLFRYWSYMPLFIRPFLVKKICLYGSESVGKTTLAKELAAYYQTDWVPEMARTYLGDKVCVYDDFVPIAELQIAELKRKTRTANRLLFCDSDLITTELYARIYFNDCPRAVLDLQKKEDYDLYLFLEADVPWVADGMRDLGDPSVRATTRNLFFNTLRERGIEPVMIKGDWANRKAQAIAAIDRILI